MDTKTPVTIIGAGIVGICCALSLLERGVPVRLIDRGAPGQETSFGNAGVISPWSIIPQSLPNVWKNIPKWLIDPNGPLSVRPTFWTRMIPWGLKFLSQTSERKVHQLSDAMELLCAPSIELYRRHLAGTGQEGLVVDSYYVHAFRAMKKANIDAIDYRIRREKGGQVQLIGAEDIRALEPALSKEFQAAILIKGQARTKSPGRIGQILFDKAMSLGATFETANLSHIEHVSNQKWHLYSADRIFTADKVVLAAGIWSAKFLTPLGIKLPMVAERGYHVQFANPGIELTHSVMDVDNKVVASSMLDGLRLAGSSEFAEPDAPADMRKKALLTKQARALCPDLNVTDDNTSFWLGRRPSLPDSLPILGEIEGYAGLYGAFGHSHYGLMMAPKTGDILADIVTDRPVNIELNPFLHTRF